DLFGTEAQDKATAISGQVAQAAAQLSIAVDEEFDMIVPGSATVDQGLAEAPMMDDSMEMSDAGTIAEVAVEAGVFNTLVTALTEADLAGTFADPDAGPFTVFAPTDDAFAALPEGTIEELLADPTGALTDILLYHVAEGAVDAATVVTLDSATTLGGQDVTIEVVDGGVVLNGSVNVVTTDIKASNGIIHIIDAVLIPDANASSAAAVECEDGQRLVEHAGGETCIPEDPQRIAVAGDRHVSETLIAMGIEPVAITNWDEIPEFVQAEFSDFEAVVNLGGNWEPNLEALVEVGPDLIITHGDDFYDSLSLIAPTVKINSPYEGVEGLVTDVGAIFGDEQTDVLLALLDDAVETVTCAVDNPEEITVSIIDHFNGGIGLNTTIPWNTSAFLIQEAGFSIPDAHVAEEISDLRGLSLERLDTLEDAEVLFVLRYFLEDENPETLLESPLWQSLEVVQSGNVLDGNFRWWSVGGPLATQRTAEEMVAGLIDFGLATPCEDSATVECEAGQRLFDNELLATDPVCIPENPQRIVALAPAPFEVMLALGETPPVGAIGYLESIYQRNFPYTNDTAAEVTFVGFPANLELVVELEPDLIIQSPFGQEDIEQVQEIAPTVVLPQLPNVRWEENMMFTADILNKTAEVEALITDYNERVDTLRDLIGDPSAIEISVVRYYNDGGAPGLQLQLANAFSTDMLADIGFARPESQAYTAEEATEVYGGAVAATLSLEQLPLVDGEYLFAWSQAPDAEGDAANEGAWAQLSEDPLWGTLQAVQNGQNYQVGGHWVGWGFHAAHEVLDDLFVQVAGVDPAEVSPNPFAE
ncbi:MAG: ABC transporter substrate-binding protein, partial [Chloroflexota bacterium]